jgi:2,3-bisphosphoglycerate-independent phosphoglycerate mutase
LPDHSTPASIGTHRESGALVIASPNLKPDSVKAFDEFSASKGEFGRVEKEYLISLLFAAGKS